ncbi:MAG: hypothetical protein WC968_01295 [Bacilli bacterium]
MNEKTIKNIKETLEEMSNADENYFLLLTNILDIELNNASDQEKNNSIKQLIDSYNKKRSNV